MNGGNTDTKHLIVGSTIYVPVLTPGALFSIGDGHAAQGDGEVCGTAIETPMQITLRLTVRKDVPIAELQYWFPRISSGSTCYEREYLVLLPIPVPSPVEHQGAECSERITRLQAPVHAPPLLPPGDDQIVRFLGVATADISPFHAPLSIVRDPRCACLQLQICDERVQRFHIPRQRSIVLQEVNRRRNFAAPEASVQPLQQLLLRLVIVADSTDHLTAFLLQMLPI